MEKQLFDPWPERYEKWFQTPIGKLVCFIEWQHINDLLAPGPRDRILDVGCGTGIFTEQYVRMGARVTGVDLSFEMLRHGVRKPGLKAILPAVADMRKLPFPDGAFSKTVSITALEFVADAHAAVRELVRVTRKGGRLVIATLNRLSPWADRRIQNSKDDPASVFHHVCFRSPRELSRLVEQEGEIRTAVHFAKDASLQEAKTVEEHELARASETGAFVIGAWTLPG